LATVAPYASAKFEVFFLEFADLGEEAVALFVQEFLYA
jgi:hypothetical protein